MVEMRKESVNGDSNLKQKEDTSDLTASHHPIHSMDCCHRHGSVVRDSDTSSGQRGQTSGLR